MGGCCSSDSSYRTDPTIASNTIQKGPQIFKVSIFGPPNVGKTSLVLALKNQPLSPHPILSGDQATVTVVVQTSGGPVQLDIVDSCGSEFFRRATTSEYTDINCVVNVFDLSAPPSVEACLTYVYDAIRFTNNVPIFVIGNKLDLERKITKEEAEAQIKQRAPHADIGYFETTCQTPTTASEAFEAIASELLQFYGN